MINLLVALALLGQAGDEGAGDGSQQGEIVSVNYEVPLTVSYVPLYRAVQIRTVVDVAACPIPPEVPSERDIFPEAIFMQAHRVRFRDGVLPMAMDLRAFAVFQRRIGEHRGFISGAPCTYTIVSRITGQWSFVLRNADPTLMAFRWARIYIRPPQMPSTWCNLDRDSDVDLDDWLEFFRRWWTGGGDDG